MRKYQPDLEHDMQSIGKA